MKPVRNARLGVACVLVYFTMWRWFSAAAQTACPFRHSNSNNTRDLSSSSTFHVLQSNTNQSLLRHDPQLLQVAAKYGERVVAHLNDTSQTAIVQEGVHIAIDCLPWLCSKTAVPGDQEEENLVIYWFKRHYRVDSNSGTVQSIQSATTVEHVNNGHIEVGGVHKRWLNVTHTMLAVSGTNADHGEYICSVCVGRDARDSPSFTTSCQNASLTLYIIGAPPVLAKHKTGLSSSMIFIGGTIVYDIGNDFCLQRNTNTSVALRCNLLQTNHPNAVPKPIRTWHKDGDLLSNGTDISPTFFTERQLLLLGVLTPHNFILLGHDFSVLFFNTSVDNIVTPELLEEDVSVDMARDMLFDLLLGEYTCSVHNVYGMDTATTVIRECDTQTVNVATKFITTSVPQGKTKSSTLDENRTEKSLQTPDGSIVCQMEVDSYYGIHWEATPTNTTAIESCGIKYTGVARRMCDSNGTWLVPDVMECQKMSFATVLRQTIELVQSHALPKHQVALNITEELSALTNPVNVSTSIFPQDLNTTVYILENTVDLLLEVEQMDINKSTIINESSTIIEVASNILEDSNKVGIQALQEDEPLFSQTLLNTIERYGYYVAQMASSTDSGDVIITTKNIMLKAETFEDMTESKRVPVSFFSTPVVLFPASVQLPVNLLMRITNRTILPIANILIHNLQQYLPLSSTDNRTGTRPVSAILSSQVAVDEGSFESLKEPVVMNFTVDVDSIEDGEELECVFWNYTNNVGSGGWSTDNVTTVRSSTFENKTTVQCSSTHLTSFAVLVNIAGNRDDVLTNNHLEYLSEIGLMLSILCLLPTIIFFLSFGKQLLTEVHYFVHLNLSMALFIANLIFVTGAETAIEIKIACRIIAALLHYFYLTVFCWMLCEGIMLFLMLVLVFSELAKKWWFFLLLGWLPPIVFVGIGAAAYRGKYGLSDSKLYCWLSSETAWWTFILPMLAIMLINGIFLVLILVTLCRKYKRKRHNSNNKGKGYRTVVTTVKASVILLPLLGLTWFIGLFFVNTQTTAFVWIFTGLNSFQGVFIFVFHVVRNERVWGRIKKWYVSFKTRIQRSQATASVPPQAQHRTGDKQNHTNRKYETQSLDNGTTMNSGSTLVLNSLATANHTEAAADHELDNPESH